MKAGRDKPEGRVARSALRHSRVLAKPFPGTRERQPVPQAASWRDEHAAARSAAAGNHVNVDVETDGFWELLQAEHIDMTALTWRESRCMFYSSPRKAHPKRLQRTRPVRQPRKGTDVLIWLSAAVGSCAYPCRLII